MQSFGLVLFPVILAFARAAEPTIFETVFHIPDTNANGAWEMDEIRGQVGESFGILGNSFFEELDTNGDLRITTEELKKFCVEVLAGIFKLNDPNGDGFITSVELLSGDAPTDANSGLLAILFKILNVNKDGFLSTEDAFPQDSYGNPNPLVVYMDDNNDGVIGLREYNQKHFLFGLPPAPEQLVKLYNKIDKNSDDKFTLAEIEGFLTTCAAIMDGNSDGIITMDEQLNTFKQAGLTQAQAEVGIRNFQLSRSSDTVNNIMDILDVDNDEQVSQAEVTGILDYPFNSPKMMQLVVLSQQMGGTDNFQLEPESALSGQQGLEALGRFLDNPRFN